MTGVFLLMSCTSLNERFLKEIPEQSVEEEDLLAGPPRLECDQESLGFDTLSVLGGESETLIITCNNPGTGSVVINNMLTASDYFEVSSVSTTTIAAGGVVDISVTFTPTHNDVFADELVMFTDAHASAQFNFVLSGSGLAPEVLLSPETLSFGAIAVGCEATATATVSNIGTEALTVSALDLPAPFEFGSAPSLPWTIAAGDFRDIDLSYAPEGSQSNSEVLTVTSTDPLNAARIISLTGSGVLSGEQSDVFFQSEGMVADTLFAISDSSSLTDNIAELLGDFDTYVETLDDLGVDYRITILTDAGGAVFGPVDYIDSPTSATSRATAMLANADSENNGLTLQLLLDGIDANDSWLRDGRLNLIGMSDEPDISGGSYTYFVSEYQSRVLDPADAVVHGIGGDYPAGCGVGWDAEPYTGVYEASVTTLGSFYSLCTDDWDSLLTGLAIDSAPTTDRFRLTSPAISDSITVSIDGSAVGFGWSYADTEQAVVFTNIPEPGAEIAVSYEVLGACP
ncbi:MAG: hypothetical protein ACI8RZ_001891 [Myxococcota bacterium]|jgi:hypothetical protein